MQAFKQRVKRDFSSAAHHYHRKASWQKSVAENLLKRFNPYIAAPVLDIGCGTGFIAEKQKPLHSVTQIDIAPEMCRQASHFGPVAAMDMEALALKSATFRTVTSSLALQWSLEIDKTCGGVFRVLQPGGYFIFATLANPTLSELREVVGSEKMHPFLEVEEMEHALKRAGFKDIELQVHKERREYADFRMLLQDIKNVGATHKNGRVRGLLGKARFERKAATYKERFASEGGVYATWEVVYGIARKS